MPFAAPQPPSYDVPPSDFSQRIATCAIASTRRQTIIANTTMNKTQLRFIEQEYIFLLSTQNPFPMAKTTTCNGNLPKYSKEKNKPGQFFRSFALFCSKNYLS